MKKQYTTPEVKIFKVNPSEIICTSAGFGSGSTDVMHTIGLRNPFSDFENRWDE